MPAAGENVFEVPPSPPPSPSGNETLESLLALKKWALGARRPALGWGSLLLALGSRFFRLVSKNN